MKKIGLIVLLITGVLLTESCTDVPTTGGTPEIGSVRFIHMAPDVAVDSVDLLVDDRVVELRTDTAIVGRDTLRRTDRMFAFVNRPNVRRLTPFPLGSPNPASYGGNPFLYLGDTDFLAFDVGNRNYKVFNAAPVSARPSNAPSPTLNVSVNVERNKAYSVFVAGTTASVGGNPLGTLVTQDNIPNFVDLTIPQGSFRFIHLSPNAPAVQVFATRVSSPGLTNQQIVPPTNYLNAQGNFDFSPIDSGRYALRVSTDGTNSVLNDTVIILRRRVYTLVARGLVNDTTVNRLRLSLLNYNR
jgi:hypothetical protein